MYGVMQGAARMGRPLTARQAAKEELVRVTLDETPEGAIMDQAASNRVFTIAPHFTAKLEDIAGLYFDPPARSFWTSIITFPLCQSDHRSRHTVATYSALRG